MVHSVGFQPTHAPKRFIIDSPDLAESNKRQRGISTPQTTQTNVRLHPQRFQKERRSEEISHVVRARVVMHPKIARLGVISTNISAWLFVPSSMSSCVMEWYMLSQVPTSESTILCSRLAQEVKIPIAFETHKEQWLDQLKTSPVDIVVIDGNIRLPAANHWFLERSITRKLCNFALPVAQRCTTRVEMCEKIYATFGSGWSH